MARKSFIETLYTAGQMVYKNVSGRIVVGRLVERPLLTKLRWKVRNPNSAHIECWWEADFKPLPPITKTCHVMGAKRYKWVVEFSVDASWVADGFEIDNERAHDMLSNAISGAFNHEIAARVLKAPDPREVWKEQGGAS